MCIVKVCPNHCVAKAHFCSFEKKKSVLEFSFIIIVQALGITMKAPIN